MNMTEMSLNEFTDILGSKSPVPGGGGASAMVGAVGTALGKMVGSLTVGKKKYADVEAQMYDLIAKSDDLCRQLLALVEEDARVFEPLAAAYGMPAGTQAEREKKESVMEEALREASEVPLEIMEKCADALTLMRVFADKGSALALSDAGVGAAFCKAAIQGASLNVFINTKAMKDRAFADRINARAGEILEQSLPLADAVFADVLGRLK